MIVADDLTGAADACVAFVMRGLEGAVMFDASKTGDATASPSLGPDASAGSRGVIAISTDSRGLPAALAADRVREAVERHLVRQQGQSANPAAPWIFKKIDSTLRGPVGAEIHAAMLASHATIAIVAPAFPAMGRVVDRGILRTTGRGAIPDVDIAQRLREDGLEGCVSVMRPAPREFRNPLSPMSGRGQGEGPGAALCDAWRDALVVARRDGARVLVCDSIVQSDLDAVVAAAYEADAADGRDGGSILWVGSAGLAHALAAHVTGVRRDFAENAGAAAVATPIRMRDSRATRSTSIVFAIGSTHPVTVAQQQRLARDAMPIASADVDDPLAIENALAMRLDVIVTLPHDAADAAVARLADVLVARERTAPRSIALVMSGGDTAARLCRELAATRIDLGGEVAPGVPWGTLSVAALPTSPVPVVLKAGGFGDDDGLIRVRRFLMEHHERS